MIFKNFIFLFKKNILILVFSLMATTFSNLIFSICLETLFIELEEKNLNVYNSHFIMTYIIPIIIGIVVLLIISYIFLMRDLVGDLNDFISLRAYAGYRKNVLYSFVIIFFFIVCLVSTLISFYFIRAIIYVAIIPSFLFLVNIALLFIFTRKLR